MKASPEEIRRHFEGASEHLADETRGQPAIVDAPTALELVGSAVSATTPCARHVLDVGCGAGNYAVRVLQQLSSDPDVTLVDLSETLLERAAERTGRATSGKVVTKAGDIRQVEVGQEQFDVVVAGAVLHHLRGDQEWESVFRKLYQSLRPGGWLWISDLVAHSSPAIRALMTKRYGRYLVEVGDELEYGGEEFRDAVFEEIEVQDTPRPLLYQTELLRDVGFSTVEVLHLDTCFATFGGERAP